MDLKTFQANTMSAALAEVKSSLGPSAVILHTRTFYRPRWLGLRRQEMVEITAGRGNRAIDPDARRSALPRPSPQKAPMIPPRPSPGQFLQSPAAQNAAMIGLTQEMESVKVMVRDLFEHARRQRAPQIPDEYLEIYNTLLRNQVQDDIASELIKSAQKQLRLDQAKRPDLIRLKLEEEIERRLTSAGPIARTKPNGPHVVALIGPTGVGKTTTIAKLAANLKLRERRKIGLVTIDTYRIAAIDQLRKYADILGSPLKVVSNTDDMREAITGMRDCEFVLIDTAGRSPNDTMKLNELKNFLAAATPDEVHLVLSTTASQTCVELAIERFADVRVDKLIFTKLDEAANVGVILNVVRKVNKGLSYLTTGQDVPDDIEVGNGKRLAQRMLSNNG